MLSHPGGFFGRVRGRKDRFFVGFSFFCVFFVVLLLFFESKVTLLVCLWFFLVCSGVFVVFNMGEVLACVFLVGFSLLQVKRHLATLLFCDFVCIVWGVCVCEQHCLPRARSVIGIGPSQDVNCTECRGIWHAIRDHIQ